MIESMEKATVVIGASSKPERYSYKAVHSLVAHNIPVIALGVKTDEVAGIPILNDRPAIKKPDTITLYINPLVQKDWEEYILSLQPRRIIFNPGTENPDLFLKAKDQGIEVLEACTLVLLATNQYSSE
jgi:predicted CoA-binding protein